MINEYAAVMKQRTAPNQKSFMVLVVSVTKKGTLALNVQRESARTAMPKVYIFYHRSSSGGILLTASRTRCLCMY